MVFDVADQIAASVSGRPAVNGIRIVGVDGCSGAGKSFLASRLASVLSAPVIEIDDFVSWDCFAGRDTHFPGKKDLWTRWMRAEDEFFGADGTRERADRIVDTSAFGVNANP
jgi:dephospho-CoA kinase